MTRIISTIASLVAATIVLTGCMVGDVTYLASDELAGRATNTEGSLLAQEYLLDYLEAWTVGINPDAEGRDAYRQAVDDGIPGGAGTNLVGIIPGTDLADEYVVVGAHYDGQDPWCDRLDDDYDTVCNSATDNATGVGAVLQVARSIVYSPTPPRRSVVIAFWDAEEWGMVGSDYFVNHSPIPLEDIAAYVNVDMIGSNLSAGARGLTFAVGAESGGSTLVDMTHDAGAPVGLHLAQFSEVFGQGRGDHASFLGVGVPSVFFSDTTGPCYHSDGDTIDIVDFDKLAEQATIISRLVRQLADGDERPVYDPARPIMSFEDAETMYDIALRFASVDDFPGAGRQIAGYRASLARIVAEGPANFDLFDMYAVGDAAFGFIGLATAQPCQGFLLEA